MSWTNHWTAYWQPHKAMTNLSQSAPIRWKCSSDIVQDLRRARTANIPSSSLLLSSHLRNTMNTLGKLCSCCPKQQMLWCEESMVELNRQSTSNLSLHWAESKFDQIERDRRRAELVQWIVNWRTVHRWVCPRCVGVKQCEAIKVLVVCPNWFHQLCQLFQRFQSQSRPPATRSNFKIPSINRHRAFRRTPSFTLLTQIGLSPSHSSHNKISLTLFASISLSVSPLTIDTQQFPCPTNHNFCGR
jgi:hypothetical protein